MTDAQKFFLAECSSRAREMKLADAVLFLRGLNESISDEEVLARINPIYVSLTESDRQLELIQGGQLKLNLPTDGHVDGSGNGDGQ